MQVVFEIDISRFASAVCELIAQRKNEMTITNDWPVFIPLLKDLAAFSKQSK